MAKTNRARIHAKVNRHDQFFLFVGAFDKSSSADDEGAPETKNLWTE